MLIKRCVSPYENTNDESKCYFLFKTILVGLTLFPIRFILLVTVLIIALPFSIIGGSCIKNIRPENELPLGGCRRCVLLPIRLVCRIIVWCFGYWWIPVEKDPIPPNHVGIHPSVVVSNHTSLLDVFYIVYRFFPAFISKASVRKVPWVGCVSAGLSTIFVDRQDPQSKTDCVNRIKCRAEYNENHPKSNCGCGCDNFPPLWVFPEGTTTNGNCLMKFQRGAFVSKKPVFPVILNYTHKCRSPSSKVNNALLMMLQFYNTMNVIRMAPIVPTDEEINDPMMFAERVRREMADRWNRPVTKHSYADFFLWESAQKSKLPKRPPVLQDFEVLEVAKYYPSLQLEELKELIRRFQLWVPEEAFLKMNFTHLKRNNAYVLSDQFSRISNENFVVPLQEAHIDENSFQTEKNMWAVSWAELQDNFFSFFDFDSNKAIDFLEVIEGTGCMLRLQSLARSADGSKHVDGIDSSETNGSSGNDGKVGGLNNENESEEMTRMLLRLTFYILTTRTRIHDTSNKNIEQSVIGQANLPSKDTVQTSLLQSQRSLTDENSMSNGFIPHERRLLCKDFLLDMNQLCQQLRNQSQEDISQYGLNDRSSLPSWIYKLYWGCEEDNGLAVEEFVPRDMFFNHFYETVIHQFNESETKQMWKLLYGILCERIELAKSEGFQGLLIDIWEVVKDEKLIEIGNKQREERSKKRSPKKQE